MLKINPLCRRTLVLTTAVLLTSCDAPLSVQSQHATPSLSDVIKESSEGAYVVCKQNGIVSFTGQSVGAVNVSAQHIIYRDKDTEQLVFIQNMGGQCRLSRTPDPQSNSVSPVVEEKSVPPTPAQR